MEYNLKINEAQAQVLTDALNIYARLGMGQIYEILEHPDLRQRMLDSLETYGIMGYCREVCEMLRRTIFGLPANTYYSISNREISDRNRIAYDLLQVIRHRLVWDRAGNPPERDHKTMFGPIYDEPMHFSEEQPLPSIDRLDSQA